MTNKCFSHHISTKALRALILETIRMVSRYAISNEAEVTKRLREASQLRQAEAARDLKRKLTLDRKRSAGLDVCAKHLRTAPNNLNQIARRINSGGGYYPDEIDEIQTALAENRALFGDILERFSKIT